MTDSEPCYHEIIDWDRGNCADCPMRNWSMLGDLRDRLKRWVKIAGDIGIQLEIRMETLIKTQDKLEKAEARIKELEGELVDSERNRRRNAENCRKWEQAFGPRLDQIKKLQARIKELEL